MIIPVFDELKALLRRSGLPLTYVSYRSGVCRKTLTMWLNSAIYFPRIDTMLKVAAVLGQHIELTPTVAKMVNYYPRQEIKPPPPIPLKGVSRHGVRTTVTRLQ